MNCLNCNTQNETTAQFCENCGTNLEKQILQKPNATYKKQKKKSNPLLILLIVFGIIAASVLTILTAIGEINPLEIFEKKVKEPSEMGRYTFDLIQNMDKMNTSDFVEKFISKDGIEHAQNQESSVYDIPDEIFQNNIESHFNKIKSTGLEYGIKWNEIAYMDFVYEKTSGDAVAIFNISNYAYYLSNYYSGTLYFKHKDKQYIADIIFMRINNYDTNYKTIYKLHDIKISERNKSEDAATEATTETPVQEKRKKSKYTGAERHP